jgi:hypothetical protein
MGEEYDEYGKVELLNSLHLIIFLIKITSHSVCMYMWAKY